MIEFGEKFFHGPSLAQGPWNSKTHVCCILCKTKNPLLSRTRHWSKGLCRSCYRRVNIKHRLYNDSYQKDENYSKSNKKRYKQIKDPQSIKFDRMDLETLLDRYSWKCAYCSTPLQGHDHKQSNAFQLEYLITPEDVVVLLPVCRSCNCSKKNITDEENLKKWCEEKNLPYPIKIISLEEYLNS